MPINRIVKIFIVLALFINPINACQPKNTDCDISLEIASNKDNLRRLCLKNNDIYKIGIIESPTETKVDFFLVPELAAQLKEISGSNIGEQLILKVHDKQIASGIIAEALTDGAISFTMTSKNNAISIAEKIGKLPDYQKIIPHEKKIIPKSLKRGVENKWHKEALNALSQGEYQKAIEYQKKAIAEEPEDPIQYAALSTIYYIQNYKDLALKELLKSEKLISKENIQKYPGVFLSLAKLYFEFGEYDQSIERYNKLLSADSNNLNARLGLATSYEKAGKVKQALIEYNFLIESGDAYFNQQGRESANRIADHENKQ
jgi:tetratricopeptide (TPR) repeat protein